VRALRVLFRLLVGLAFLAAVLAGFVYWRSAAVLDRRFAVALPPAAAPAAVPDLANGRHLAATRGCFGCHGPDLGGAVVIDSGAMGLISGPNLTRGQGGLPPTFSAADFERAIRHGVAPVGRGLFLMPSRDYSHLTVDDMTDLVAYLESVPPVDRAGAPLRLGPVSRALLATGKMRLAAAEIDHAALQPDVVARAITPAYGRYVAASCTGCHGERFSGGKIAAGPPSWPPAANLTPAGDLAKWTEADFIATLRTGKKPDGTALNPVMPRNFGLMDNTELKAVWSYLQTLPPVATGGH
jgi:mono/diheme cytochrome c family protein